MILKKIKTASARLKKTIFIVIGSIFITILAVIILISPVAKYLVERYDEKYTGRQITMGWVYVNPFTGYVHISNLKIYESKSLPFFKADDSIFFSAKGISANFAMLKLLSKTIEITKITLDQPKGIIIQEKKELNFSDLIQLFTPEQRDKTPSSVHVNLLGIKIMDGEFHYRERMTPINYFIEKVNLESDGKRWNADSITTNFSFFQGKGSGDMKGNFTINFKTRGYRLAVIVHKFDLNLIEQYLKDISNNSNFKANIDADIKAKGSFTDGENITASGRLAVNDFHFGKNPEDDYAAFDKLALEITEISPKNHKYLFDSISLNHPFLKYELYDHMDNFQAMFGKNGSKITSAASDPSKFNLVIEIARYVKLLVRNFFYSDYKVNRFAIYKGDLKFNDFSISEKFTADLNPLNFFADSIYKSQNRVQASLKSGIKPFGDVTVTLSINPKDSLDFDIQYHLQKVPVTLFNPYLITYTSYPLDRGTIEINGTWRVRNAMIQSDNHVVIIDPRRTNRVRRKDSKWLPLPLIMSLIRERGNVIDYEIPITGDLKDPKFHLHDVLMDVVENIFVKPSTAPYRLEVKNLETEIEKALTLKWVMRQNSILHSQEKFIKRLVDYLVDYPKASLAVYPIQYAEKEIEYISFFEAKKKYFLATNTSDKQGFNEEDSIQVDKMSVKDSLFINYLNNQVSDTMLFTVQDKCRNLIGTVAINAMFIRLIRERENAFILYFKEKSVEKRVKIHSGENDIPYNGFSYFKIDYIGELPVHLLKAYRKMNEVNDEAPRNKYKKERKKNKTMSKG
ncbi:MAG: DUF748 domain-containing protein [Bacteroidales bacterium]|nr:DUF748 domain-containing protein [Bacteroidales bacterium]